MTKKDQELLQALCAIHAPSGSELAVRDYLINCIKENKSSWKVQPQLVFGDDFQDCLILIFGQPRTAIYAHMDSVGYSVGYKNELLKIGGPQAKEKTILIGEDSQGKIEGKLDFEIEEEVDERKVVKTKIIFDREIDRGTTLTYKPNWIETDTHIQNCYLDDRLGIWNALKVAETLDNGAIVFSAWEEVGGGSVGYLAKYLYENYQIRQSLISDITWVTNGVKDGKGVAISMRDSGIPRRSYIDKIIELAKASGVTFQLEVESAGGSDGNALQKSPFPIDWCFIGAPENNVHMPTESVNKKDAEAMHLLYSYLMKNL
ncbi:MAG: putative aminopeptidase FrvX [Vicingaceae bacterium]|jgi:putative aminopeptidase FrvX|tara:strand:+ start:329 stop:1279 length:951 start_codon:yes stop_codon:yes gene_type:complete